MPCSSILCKHRQRRPAGSAPAQVCPCCCAAHVYVSCRGVVGIKYRQGACRKGPRAGPCWQPCRKLHLHACMYVCMLRWRRCECQGLLLTTAVAFGVFCLQCPAATSPTGLPQPSATQAPCHPRLTGARAVRIVTGQNTPVIGHAATSTLTPSMATGEPAGLCMHGSRVPGAGLRPYTSFSCAGQPSPSSADLCVLSSTAGTVLPCKRLPGHYMIYWCATLHTVTVSGGTTAGTHG